MFDEGKLSDKGPKLSDKGPKLSDKGPKLSDKGPKLSDKGPKLSDKGEPNDVAEDVFRRVSGLGGFLFVAFVAPMAPNNGAVRNGITTRDSVLAVLGNKALERDAEAEEARRQHEERDRELVAKLASSIMAQSAKPARRAKPAKPAARRSSRRQRNWSLKSVKA